MLKAMKIGSPGLVQGYNFSVDNGVGGKIMERFSDLREAFVEVLAVPRIQNSFTAFDCNGAITVEFDFVGPSWSLGQL